MAVSRKVPSLAKGADKLGVKRQRMEEEEANSEQKFVPGGKQILRSPVDRG